MTWVEALAHTLFWLTLIASIILFAVKRKWSPVMYLISIAMYIFTVAYVIDAFRLSKNWVLLLLLFSTFLMFGFGFYLREKA
jgi:hypothetical protein